MLRWEGRVRLTPHLTSASSTKGSGESYTWRSKVRPTSLHMTFMHRIMGCTLVCYLENHMIITVIENTNLTVLFGVKQK